MKALEIAHKYMASFYGIEPLENMKSLLADNFDFEGPLYKFTSGEEYVESLKENPMKGASIKVINEYEDENSACLIYQFSKPHIDTLMAQYFEIQNCKIAKIRLIFDANKFT